MNANGRPRKESEMARKQVGRAGRLEVELDGDRVVSTRYVPAPKVAPTLPSPARGGGN